MIERVTFIGSKEIGLRALQTMFEIAPRSVCQIITFDDSSDKRSRFREFEQFAAAHEIPFDVPRRPSQLDELLQRSRPDLCVVVGWYWILKPETLALAPAGFVGAHASKLPSYRGGAPLVWSVIKGEREGGITLFYFDEEMDNGDIIAQHRFQIEPLETISDLLVKAEAGLSVLLRENYPLLLKGTAPRLPQDKSLATYCAQRRPEDGRIDWKLASSQVHDFIRAQTHPYPGAYTILGGGQKIHIWKSEPFPHGYLGPPGRVVQQADDHVVVTCGEGAVKIFQVEVNDWGAVPAPEMLQVGAQLA
ncbi:MAG: methionyl-tRNA formyltransferase [bacterium]